MRIILSIFIFVLGAQAQQTPPPEQVILGYTQDIQIKGKTYERYQTPKGDNVLIGKEAAKRNGIFLFESAKHILRKETMFSIALPMVNLGVAGFDPDKIARTDEARRRAAALGPDYSPAEINKHAFTMITGLSFRPSSYRHVQATGTYDIAARAIFVAAEHDLIVIPGFESLNALSAGYFYARSRALQVYKLNGSTQTEEFRVPFNDTGLSVSFRHFLEDIGSGPGSLVVTVRLGKNGTRQLYTGMQFGFGGK